MAGGDNPSEKIGKLIDDAEKLVKKLKDEHAKLIAESEKLIEANLDKDEKDKDAKGQYKCFIKNCYKGRDKDGYEKMGCLKNHMIKEHITTLRNSPGV